MAYVNSDGTISQKPPIFEQIIRFVFGVFTFIICFFKSLLGLDTLNSSSNNSGSSSRGSSGGFWSGGGGGGNGNNSFGNGRPNIRTMKDINPPTVKGMGGCPGGGCGM